jgi:general secretion pathway protein G
MVAMALLASGACRSRAVDAREAVLRTDLRTLREVIDQYRDDRHRYPPSLEAMVAAGYLRVVPIDAVTGRADTWIEIREEPAGESPPGVVDVRSGSDRLASDGTPYSQW